MNLGHEVIAIAPHDDYSEKLEEMGCKFYPLEFPGTSTNPFTDLKLIWRLYLILRNARPDIMLTYTIKPNIYASLVSFPLRIPCICNVSGLGTVFLWKGNVKRIAVFLYRLAFRFSSWVFFQNEEDREDFLQVVRLTPSKTSILPGSGVNLTHFAEVPFINRQETTFLMISRLIIEKGVSEFSMAAKVLARSKAKAKFQVVGAYERNHARRVDEALIKEWEQGGYIEWIDHREDIRPFIQNADVIVLPSYREGTPKTLLEAGAMGKALIATDVPGCRQVVIDGYNGFLCKPKDGKDLATKMKLYLSLNHEEKQQVGKNSRKHIEANYDERLVIALYEEKIQELTMKK